MAAAANNASQWGSSGELQVNLSAEHLLSARSLSHSGSPWWPHSLSSLDAESFWEVSGLCPPGPSASPC